MKDFISQLSHFVASLGLSAINLLSSLFIAAGLFLTPIVGFLATIIVFVLVDTAVGIYVSYRLPEAKGYESHKFFNMAPKLFFYLATIVLTYFIDRFIFEGEIFEVKMLATKIITTIWTHNEIKSMDEKSVKLGNRPLLEILKSMITSAKNIKQDLNDLKN